MTLKSKHYENFSKILLQYLSGKKYEPIGQMALFKKLKISPQFHSLCKRIVKDLIDQKVITTEKRKLVLIGMRKETVTGTLRAHPRGFGFVVTDQDSPDVFIPKPLMNGAIDGDLVEVEINPHAHSEKGPDGEIIRIIERKRTHLGGVVYSKKENEEYYVFAPLLGVEKKILVSSPSRCLENGDRILIEILDWGKKDKLIRGKIAHYIGHINQAKTDVPAAICEFDLRDCFPDKAIEEAKEFGKKVSAADKKSRQDFTKLECVTIDPTTAKDYDDAISLSEDKKGYHLGVHIADVAHYVKLNSFLDVEAKKRGNSTYFPGECVPMLPEALSNELCSLKEGVERLTVSVMMDFNKKGELQHYEIVRSVIKSQKRLTYEQAKEILDGSLSSPHQELIVLMEKFALLLNQKRRERGSVDLSSSEYVVQIDQQGEPTGMKKIEYDITHQMIEEFMLKANEVVAKHLVKQGKTLIFRVHEEPTQENLTEFYSLARHMGFELPETPSQEDLQTLFKEVKKTPFAEELGIAFIRSMKLAYYSTENMGHYGLALDAYCHFTSPIRRYSDLVIQRLLFDEEVGENLETIALKNSETERASFKAEQSVILLKKLRLLKNWHKEGKTFKAHISRIKPYGLTFELDDLMLEGFLHISELGHDYFIYEADSQTLRGKSTRKRFKLGDTITPTLKEVDLVLLDTKWQFS